MADDERRTPRTWAAGAMAVALALLLGACGVEVTEGGGVGDGGRTTTTEAADGTTTTVDEEDDGDETTTTTNEDDETTTTTEADDEDDAQERAEVVSIPVDVLDDPAWSESEASTTTLTEGCDPTFDPETDPSALAVHRNPTFTSGDGPEPLTSIAITTVVYTDDDAAQDAVEAVEDTDVTSCMADAVEAGFEEDGGDATVTVLNADEYAPEPQEWIDDMSVVILTLSDVPAGGGDAEVQQALFVLYRKGDVVSKVGLQGPVTSGLDGLGVITREVQLLLDET